MTPANTRAKCINGHEMRSTQNYCSECGALRSVAVIPSVDQREASNHTAFIWLVGLAVVALLVVAVIMFTTPHASYNRYYYPSDSDSLSQQTTTGSCITAWADMAGNLTVSPPNSTQVEEDNIQSLSNSCTDVIHGRQHLAILLIVVAAVLGIAAILTRRRVTNQLVARPHLYLQTATDASSVWVVGATETRRSQAALEPDSGTGSTTTPRHAAHPPAPELSSSSTPRHAAQPPVTELSSSSTERSIERVDYDADYDLTEWTSDQRTRLTRLLDATGIPFSLGNLHLLVDRRFESEVDDILDSMK